MTDNNDDENPLDNAFDAVENFDDEVDLDPHLKRALRQITQGVDELKKAMRKRGLLPVGRH